MHTLRRKYLSPVSIGITGNGAFDAVPGVTGGEFCPFPLQAAATLRLVPGAADFTFDIVPVPVRKASTSFPP